MPSVQEGQFLLQGFKGGLMYLNTSPVNLAGGV
jgi:hypothetical protein